MANLEWPFQLIQTSDRVSRSGDGVLCIGGGEGVEVGGLGGGRVWLLMMCFPNGPGGWIWWPGKGRYSNTTSGSQCHPCAPPSLSSTEHLYLASSMQAWIFRTIYWMCCPSFWIFWKDPEIDKGLMSSWSWGRSGGGIIWSFWNLSGATEVKQRVGWWYGIPVAALVKYNCLLLCLSHIPTLADSTKMNSSEYMPILTQSDKEMERKAASTAKLLRWTWEENEIWEEFSTPSNI